MNMHDQQRDREKEQDLYVTWSACLDRCAEDVRIQALVIAKLKLVDVEMEILLADLMERADDPAFHDGPEAFDGVGMNRSADIFPISMMQQCRDGIPVPS